MRRPRRRSALPVLLACLVAGVAAAQDLPEGHGALPRGEGTLTGRVLREGGGEPLAGVDVVLYVMDQEGRPGLAGGVTDAEGRFRFDGLATDPALSYLVGTRVGEVPFGARVSFEPGAREASAELRVASLSPDGSALRARAAVLRIERGCEGLRVGESHELENTGDAALFVPEAERATRPPLFETELPEQATDFATVFGEGRLGIELDGRRVRYWGPVYPGSEQLAFAYALPGGAGVLEIERKLLRDLPELAVLTPPEGLRASGPGLREEAERTVEGRRYRVVARRGLAAGERVSLRVEVPEAPAPAVELARGEVWLELDDAAMVVDESLLLRAGLEGPRTAGAGAPLLCLPLPEGASSLRFSPDTLAMGLEADGGGLAFRGPVPPGESRIALRYTLPVDGDPSFSRRFGHALPALSIFVADTGVAPETGRLHRRRTVRRADRSYLHFEAFDVGAGEQVVLGLPRVSPRRPLPRLASLGFVLLAAAGAILFLTGPLRARRSEADVGESEAARLEAEREAVYAAIRDLEEDYETEKLTTADYERLRSGLRARAVALLQREREARERAERGRPQPESAPAAAPAPRFCVQCGAELPPAARFCPQCGQATAVREAG